MEGSNVDPVVRAHAIDGDFHVRVFRPAWGDTGRLFTKAKDCFELRSHALKLRFWPAATSQDDGQVLDMNWSWVQALKGKGVGELRIEDEIGGHDNLRIIFYCGDNNCPDRNSKNPSYGYCR